MKGIVQTVDMKSMPENFDAFTQYYGDITLWEPVLLRVYDEVVPQIDRALSESPEKNRASSDPLTSSVNRNLQCAIEDSA